MIVRRAERPSRGSMLLIGALVAALLATLPAMDVARAQAPGGPEARGIDLACPDPAPPTFGDVAGSPHAAAIGCLVELRLTEGTGDGSRFSPRREVTRAQMASFVVRLIEDLAGELERGESFGDYHAGFEHAAAIDKLAAIGVVEGVGGGRFAPLAPVTRAQMGSFVRRALSHLATGDARRGTLPPAAAGALFPDIDAGGPHGANVQAIAAVGIVAGFTDGTYRPASAVLRDQMASYVARTYDYAVEQGLDQPGPGPEPGEVEVEIASGRPDTVTGGNALVRIHLGDDVAPSDARVEIVDGDTVRDVTAAFEVEDGAGSLLGLVEGLPGGDAVLSARAVDGDRSGPAHHLPVTNHPVHGPVFSGPHQTPFRCDFDDSSGLGQDKDGYCHVAEPVVEHYYLPEDADGRPTVGNAGFVALADPTQVPDDAVTTTTTEGAEVPFVVRNERGTLNRGVYNIAVLHDASQDEWGDPLRPQEQWNERLYYQLEGACRPGFGQDRERAQDILSSGQVDVLGAGFAVARHTFTRHGNACGNDVLSAESMMMVREHFTKTHGEPLHMIGNGGSGGAIQQYLIADNYPGILDGIIAGSTFPDAFSMGSGAGDTLFLHEAFLESDLWDYSLADAALFPGGWSPAIEERLAELTAVSGFGAWAINLTWVIGNARNVDPTTYIGREWSEDELYDPETGEGLRATIYEAGVNSFGYDPETGYARRPLDNTGVQYGLAVLEAGTITPEQFVDVNERAGGIDINAIPTEERMDADGDVIALAYRTGRIMNGGMGLAEVPMLNFGRYQDTVELGADYHDRFRDFSVRARLLRGQGHFDNHVIWHAHPAAVPADLGDLSRLLVMDAWVTAIGGDERDVSTEQKVVDNRPTDLTDRCWTADGTEHTVTQWPHDDLSNPCIDELRPYGDPRTVAGASIENDVLKCEKKPLDPDDYGVEFTADQWDRLEALFTDGVCDWSRPGVGQQPPIDTWLRFDTPGQPIPMG